MSVAIHPSGNAGPDSLLDTDVQREAAASQRMLRVGQRTSFYKLYKALAPVLRAQAAMN